jgi:uncharacterized protein
MFCSMIRQRVDSGKEKLRMRLLVIGASGYLGTHLVRYLKSHEHEIDTLKRGTAVWDPDRGIVQDEALEGYDVVVNFAGSPLYRGMFRRVHYEDMYRSRIGTTLLLSEALRRLEMPPRIFLQASAISYYGTRGSAALSEDSAPGDTPLALLCRDWEESAEAASSEKTRVITLRTGVVLSSDGGALRSLLPIFGLGLGGKIGSGHQWMSWIHMHDFLRLVEFLILHPTVDGPFCAVGPNPCTNETFTKTLGALLHRPTFFTVPPWLLKILYGTPVEELLSSSLKCLPIRAEELGFQFAYHELIDALMAEIGEKGIPLT